ncbi:MAG: type II toxin-antitoxin system prevent-host-death family antitoxin [Solirubrobacterales bacterium]
MRAALDRPTVDHQDAGSYLRSYLLHEIGIKELKNSASRVIAEVEAGERVVVTKRGRPAAVIMSMGDVEDFVLAHAEEYVEMRLKARAAYSAGETVGLDDV